MDTNQITNQSVFVEILTRVISEAMRRNTQRHKLYALENIVLNRVTPDAMSVDKDVLGAIVRLDYEVDINRADDAEPNDFVRDNVKPVIIRAFEYSGMELDFGYIKNSYNRKEGNILFYHLTFHVGAIHKDLV